MKAIVVSRRGGPEVLEYVDVPDPAPGPLQAVVQVKAIGVNYRDIYARSDTAPAPLSATGFPEVPPFIPGVEAAGVVVQVGSKVSEVAVGDLVAYYYNNTPDEANAAVPSGIRQMRSSYAEQVVVPAWRLAKVPPGVGAETAAAVITQGMTAHFLSHTIYPLKRGDTALVHAGAGGVGLLLIQMAKRRGARVIATTSTEEKARIAREAGADETILYTKQDFEAEAKRLTDGAGVNVVYDSVGLATFQKSMACLARRGHLVSYGHASGHPPPVPVAAINRASLFVTSPRLDHYTATRKEVLQRAGDVLEGVRSGKLKVRIHGRFPLRDAAEAHRLLEGRGVIGKLVLIP
ncbi:MAG: quinone oxidoreductase [Chloroflexi bacterium]|nr:quinone oxidoreductase [Chloroflexota bacterium]